MIYVLSGGTKLFAAICVTYPEGSTLTCTDGTKTLKAKTTTGQWVFSIPCTGTWTVTATDGTNTKSQSVEITAEGQFEEVELSYWDGTLYDAGNEYTEITGGWGTRGSASKKSTYLDVYIPGSGGRGGVQTNNAIDLTKWATLHCTATNVSNFMDFGVAESIASDTVNQEWVSEVQVKSNSTYSVDISSLSGSYYIAASQFTRTSSETYGGDIIKVWLS